MKFVLVEEYGYGVQEDAYIDGDPKVDDEYLESWDGLNEWLEENMAGRYVFDRDYDHIDYTTIKITLLLILKNEWDAAAFKLRWL